MTFHLHTNRLIQSLPLIAFTAVLASAQQYVAIDLTPNAGAGAMGFAVSGVAGGSVMALGPQNAYVQHAAEFSNGAINDIHPPSWVMSVVMGMAGNQQAGLGLPVLSTDNSSGTHAVAWSGSAAGMVDLQPSSLVSSAATCINGGFTHAALWNGTSSAAIDLHPAVGFDSSASSAVDLNQFLPAGVTDAQAMAIDAAGNIVGYAGNHAYMWTPVR